MDIRVNFLFLLSVSSLILVLQCAADGVVYVKFMKYINPGGKGANGHCCDGKGIICQDNGCDHTFTVCLDANKNSRNPNECSYGRYQSRRISNENINVFRSSIGSVLNPMSFLITGGPLPNATLRVNVYDDDRYYTEKDFVDYLQLDGAVPDAGKTQKWYEIKSRTILRVRVWSRCAVNYYGERCGAFCPPAARGMHYTCDPKTGTKICDQGWTGPNCGRMENNPDRWNADCDRLVREGNVTSSGRYEVQVGHHPPFSVYCVVTAKKEGWTVIHQRGEGSVNFTQGWEEYRDGFGTVKGGQDFWLGLEKMYLLTNQRSYRLTIVLKVGEDKGSLNTYSAKYDNFLIGPEMEHFLLHTAGYKGNAGDALRSEHQLRNHEGMPFTTHDEDNDMWPDNNCAKISSCGWWYNDCFFALLTGVPKCQGETCLSWHTLPHGSTVFSSTMMILPNPRR